MIQINELRIGNWIKQSFEGRINEAVQVKALKIDGIVTDFHFEAEGSTGSMYGNYKAVVKETILTYEDALPIELNEKVLEQFGFKCLTEYSGTGAEVVYQILFDSKPITLWKWSLVSWNFQQWNKRELKYLHELQNLYYSLTGSELATVTK